MKKNRINDPSVLPAAEDRLQKNPSDHIPVFLFLVLCILAVSVYSNQKQHHQKNQISVEAAEKNRYVWISGSQELKSGLYLFTPEKLKSIFRDLYPISYKAVETGHESIVSAIQYNTGVPETVNLPPAIANIFFQPIPLNLADKNILEVLPGIGPSLAEKIIHQRENYGPFRSKDELLEISGIGPKKLARMREYITLDW